MRLKIKLIIWTAALCGVCFPLFGTAPEKGNPVIEFVGGNVVELGRFEASERRDTTMYVTNKGDGTLVIFDVQSDCGCAVATYEKKEVAPGDTLEIKVGFNGAGRSAGDFRRQIRIRSNASNGMACGYVRGIIKKVYVE